MYHPTTRVLTVLELLQARGRLSGGELASRLEVDPRSVRRYVTMLQDMGIPIVGVRGRHGGYRLRPGFKLPPLMLTDEEALAVTLGLLAARQLGLAAAAPAVEGALAKLERVLPEPVRDRALSVQEAVVFDLPPIKSTADSAVVAAFSTAVSQSRRVQVTYHSWQAKTERAVDPYGLVYRLGAWYSVGWCHLRSDLRVFRLDRVEAVTILDERFQRPDGFDSRGHVQRAIARTPGQWSVEVALHTSLEEVGRRISPVFGAIEPCAEGVLLRCEVDSLDRMAHHLAGLPWPLVVRRPPELVGALHNLAQHASRLAEASEGAGRPVLSRSM